VSGHRKKKHHEEEHENHERWLVSYADFITLLFAFFVVMYSVSRVDTKKLAQVSSGLRWALHMAGTGGTGAMPIFDGAPSEGGCQVMAGSGVRSAEQARLVEEVRRRIERRVAQYLLQKKGPPTVVMQIEEGHRLVIRLASSEFFDSGQAAIRPKVLPVLDALASELKELDRPLRVEGHTDDTRRRGGPFRGNWDLSAARAASVTAYLEAAHGVPPGHLSAVGLANTRPLSMEPTAEAQEMNRRVELVVEFQHDDPLLHPGENKR
jgi:chemotaxis protein MotB